MCYRKFWSQIILNFAVRRWLALTFFHFFRLFNSLFFFLFLFFGRFFFLFLILVFGNDDLFVVLSSVDRSNNEITVYITLTLLSSLVVDELLTLFLFGCRVFSGLIFGILGLLLGDRSLSRDWLGDGATNCYVFIITVVVFVSPVALRGKHLLLFFDHWLGFHFS